MKRHFDEDLGQLKNDILKMGSMVEDAVLRSIEALKDRDEKAAKKVILDDRAIDEMELFMDEECLDLLALMQPMAVDLRFVTMAMKITTDLERMADLAVDIAQRVLELSPRPHLKELVDIPKLASLCRKMIKDAISSFVNNDPDMAGKVILLDSEADKLRNAVQNELVNDYMSKDPATVSRGVPLLLVARHLERICDHATNIAEAVIYMVRAQVVKHHPEKLK